MAPKINDRTRDVVRNVITEAGGQTNLDGKTLDGIIEKAARESRTSGTRVSMPEIKDVLTQEFGATTPDPNLWMNISPKMKERLASAFGALMKTSVWSLTQLGGLLKETRETPPPELKFEANGPVDQKKAGWVAEAFMRSFVGPPGKPKTGLRLHNIHPCVDGGTRGMSWRSVNTTGSNFSVDMLPSDDDVKAKLYLDGKVVGSGTIFGLGEKLQGIVNDYDNRKQATEGAIADAELVAMKGLANSIVLNAPELAEIAACLKKNFPSDMP